MNFKRAFFIGFIAFSAVVAISVATFIGSIIYARVFDESPDPGRDKFLKSTQPDIPDEQNIAVALAGLSAPLGADVIRHGRLLINIHRLESGDSDEVIKKKESAAGKLAFIGSRDELECWAFPQPISPNTTSQCADATRLKTLLEHNAELLRRYRHAQAMPGFNSTLYMGGQTVLDVHRLMSAGIKLELTEGNAEKAYLEWRNSFIFVGRLLASERTGIDSAIFLVMDRINLYMLENMLLMHPELAKQHYTEFTRLLLRSHIGRYNLEGVARGDCGFFEHFIKNHQEASALHPEFQKNRCYRINKKLVTVAQHPESLKENTAKLTKSYLADDFWSIYFWPLYQITSIEDVTDSIKYPIDSLALRLVAEGWKKSTELFHQYHIHNGLMRLLHLSIQIRHQKIPPQDIPAFLRNADTALYNPFTKQSMNWDANRKILYFEHRGQKIEVRL